jgi:hypothetical protein
VGAVQDGRDVPDGGEPPIQRQAQVAVWCWMNGQRPRLILC